MSEPAIEWEYRNITCRVYRLEQIRTLAYAKIGDVWVNVYDDDGREPQDMQSHVESEVDQLLNTIQDTEETEWPLDKAPEPIDPQPLDTSPIDTSPIDTSPIDPDPLDPYPRDDPQCQATVLALKHSDRKI